MTLSSWPNWATTTSLLWTIYSFSKIPSVCSRQFHWKTVDACEEISKTTMKQCTRKELLNKHFGEFMWHRGFLRRNGNGKNVKIAQRKIACANLNTTCSPPRGMCPLELRQYEVANHTLHCLYHFKLFFIFIHSLNLLHLGLFLLFV